MADLTQALNHQSWTSVLALLFSTGNLGFSPNAQLSSLRRVTFIPLHAEDRQVSIVLPQMTRVS